MMAPEYGFQKTRFQLLPDELEHPARDTFRVGDQVLVAHDETALRVQASERIEVLAVRGPDARRAQQRDVGEAELLIRLVHHPQAGDPELFLERVDHRESGVEGVPDDDDEFALPAEQRADEIRQNRIVRRLLRPSRFPRFGGQLPHDREHQRPKMLDEARFGHPQRREIRHRMRRFVEVAQREQKPGFARTVNPGMRIEDPPHQRRARARSAQDKDGKSVGRCRSHAARRRA